ncbi:MAG: mechanosensitive ion channel [Syntrophobacterales bacterium]|jgi:small-conductance mechanosensitive channel
MRWRSVKTFLLVVILTATFVTFSIQVTAQEPPTAKPAPAEEEKPAAAPGLAELDPKATALAARLTDLENEIAALPDLSPIKENIKSVAKNEQMLSQRLESLKLSKTYETSQYSKFKEELRVESAFLERAIQPLTQSLNRMESWKKEWSDEKELWKQWQASLPKEVPASAVKPTFTKAQKTIDKALALISQHLKPILTLQQEAGDLQAWLYSLASGVDALMATLRVDILRKSTPPMYSSQYYAKFNKNLWEELQRGLAAFAWPGKQFFKSSGVLIASQVFLALIIIFVIVRYRTFLEEEKRWRFFAYRPISVGVFVAAVTLSAYYQTMPPAWTLILWSALSIAAARLVEGLITGFWRIRLFFGLAILVIITKLLEVFALPLPLFRLYVFLMALTVVFFCFWRSLEARRKDGSPFYIWSLRLCGLVFILVFAAEVVGYSDLSIVLFEVSLSTIYVILLTWMLMFMARGGLELAVRGSFLREIPFVRSNAEVIIRRSALLTNLLIAFVSLGYLLEAWQLYTTPIEALRSLLSVSITIGSWRISVGLVLAAAAVLYGSLLLSWIVQALLMEGFFTKRELEAGVRISMARLVHYGLVLVGFLLALVALGFNLRNFTIIAGALGVGIGFGLQGIVNNFVSGLILLFERPVKVGDYIQLGEQWAQIQKIGLRATVIQTFDRSEIVVPNSDLIANQVTNWTLTDRFARIIVPVGVAYGSDVPLVFETLMECAMANSKVMRLPEPQILFMGFGDSSLNFELRVWISNVDDRLTVRSDLHRDIDARFRQAGIVIAFPQRDLHIHKVDKKAAPGHQDYEIRRSSEAAVGGDGEDNG